MSRNKHKRNNFFQPKPPATLAEIEAAAQAEQCKFCHHSLEGNSHGLDQNDCEMDGDTLVHSGTCTYCTVCQTEGSGEPELGQIPPGTFDDFASGGIVDAPKTPYLVGESTTESTVPTARPASGLTMNQALSLSPFLYKAVRPLTQGYMLMTDSQRFWTVHSHNLAASHEPIFLDWSAESLRADWRPVLGNEKGWYVG